MASQPIFPVDEPLIDRSPYCFDPNCTSCEALREEYADINIKNRSTATGLLVASSPLYEPDLHFNDSAPVTG
jgi:hypothetical protein